MALFSKPYSKEREILVRALAKNLPPTPIFGKVFQLSVISYQLSVSKIYSAFHNLHLQKRGSSGDFRAGMLRKRESPVQE
ncbi:MAG: hypothetical protein AAGJ08_15430 [Cyanobacteria bacterium P01_H01_bin.35]